MSEDLVIIAVDHTIKCQLKYQLVHNSNNCLNSDRNLWSHLKQWINKLGEESAQAQSLKQSITSYNKLIDGSNEDKIYLLLKTDKCFPNERSALGFVRIGARDLWLSDRDNSNLRQIQNCFCILDFYVRHQRQGFGHFLIDKMMSSLSKKAAQFAYDRPTDAMITFLDKHFGLKQPITQYNHFVTFDTFDTNY